MNIRARIPAPASAMSRTDNVVSLARPRRLAEGFIVPIAERAAAVYVDEVAAADGRRRLTVEADGAPVGGPLVSTTVPLRGGGRRRVVLVGHRADWLVRRRLVLSLDRSPISVIDPEWLQSPLTDVAALFDGLTGEGRQRLLRLFLTTAASLLGRAATASFAQAAGRLLELLGVAHVDPVGWCRIGAAARIVSYRVPAGFDLVRLGELVALTGAAMSRVAGNPMHLEQRPGGALLHVFVGAPVPEGCALVAAGPVPLALRLPASETAALAVERWLPARDLPTRAWAEALLQTVAEADPVAQALVRELRHRTEPAPALAIRHLSGTPAGVLHAFALRDPNGLVREVRITRGEASARISVVGDDALSGYLKLPQSSSIDDRCRLALVYRSGRRVTVAEDALPRFDGTARPFMPATAVAEARLDRAPTGRVLGTEPFGTAAAEPKLSVVCPIGTSLDVVRTRAALACAETDGRAVEFVYHVAEGPDAAAARVLLAQVAATFGIRHVLTVVAPELDPADRLIAAIRAARAPRALVLGADVLPSEPGWLAPWQRLSPRHPMLGAAIAGHDGRREPDGSADCLGFARETVLGALQTTSCGAPGVLVAEVAEILRRRGTPAARLGLVFVRYGEEVLTTFEKAVDAAALQLIFKRSFNIACDDVVA